MVASEKHAQDRARDEKYLKWIAARNAGLGCAEIARGDAVTRSAVSLALKAIRDADIAESGEPPLVVDAAYWRGK